MFISLLTEDGSFYWLNPDWTTLHISRHGASTHGMKEHPPNNDCQLHASECSLPQPDDDVKHGLVIKKEEFDLKANLPGPSSGDRLDSKPNVKVEEPVFIPAKKEEEDDMDMDIDIKRECGLTQLLLSPAPTSPSREQRNLRRSTRLIRRYRMGKPAASGKRTRSRKPKIELSS
jgi:hypothetical protein